MRKLPGVILVVLSCLFLVTAANAKELRIEKFDAEIVITPEGLVDVTENIPHGTGQTYLRTILVAIDHAAYHIGQIVDTRRLIGAWPVA